MFFITLFYPIYEGYIFVVTGYSVYPNTSIAQIVENGITYFLNFFSIPVKYVTIVLQAPFSCRKEDIL